MLVPSGRLFVAFWPSVFVETNLEAAAVAVAAAAAATHPHKISLCLLFPSFSQWMVAFLTERLGIAVSDGLCVCDRGRKRERACVCVCVCVRVREHECSTCACVGACARYVDLDGLY